MMPTVATLHRFSHLCCVALARYISKPIRMLRTAFDQAASGNLSLRIGPQMANRNDELANLGHDFDGIAARLQTLIDSQRRLFHDISHELRSPLARLQIACGLARQHPDTVQKCLQRIEHECKRMDDLVGELLTLAKLDSRMSGANETVDLNKVVAEIVDDARFEGIPSGRGIALVVRRGRLLYREEAVLLYRAIENVVRNALKYAPRGTDVQVEMMQIAAGDCVRMLSATTLVLVLPTKIWRRYSNAFFSQRHRKSGYLGPRVGPCYRSRCRFGSWGNDSAPPIASAAVCALRYCCRSLKSI